MLFEWNWRIFSECEKDGDCQKTTKKPGGKGEETPRCEHGECLMPCSSDKDCLDKNKAEKKRRLRICFFSDLIVRLCNQACLPKPVFKHGLWTDPHHWEKVFPKGGGNWVCMDPCSKCKKTEICHRPKGGKKTTCGHPAHLAI